ncbi:hypothetical protein KUTeg_009562, partial [Tegillarca granosa]
MPSQALRLNNKVHTPSQSVRLAFDNEELPPFIYIFIFRHYMEKFNFPTLFCYNCQNQGHKANKCQNQTKCLTVQAITDLRTATNSLHDLKLFGDKNLQEIQISAKVYRSQRKSESPHHVNMTLHTATKTMTDGYCSCKAGEVCSSSCHYNDAENLDSRGVQRSASRTVLYESCTNLPQTWDKPRGSKIKPELVSQMVVCKPTTVNRKRRPLMANFNDNRKVHITEDKLKSLQELDGCPVSYMAQVVNKVDTTPPYDPQFIGSALSYHVPLMNPVKPTSVDSHPCDNLLFPSDIDVEMPSIVTDNEIHWQNLQLSDSQCVNIEKDTRNQAESATWMSLRKCRITASNFGKIMKRKSTINRNHAHDIGLIINPKLPYLGATPDGKVCDKGECGILEIKCPYSARDKTFKEACEDENLGTNFFLKKTDQGLSLDVNHEYWYQVQGQLCCQVLNSVTLKDFNVQRIYPERNTFINMIRDSQVFIFIMLNDISQ